MTQGTITPNFGDTDAQAQAYFLAAMQALATVHAGINEPPETLPYMLWCDTGSSPVIWRMRNASDTGWLTDLPLNFATQSAAESGTGTGIMTAARTAQAIAALAPESYALPGNAPDVVAGNTVWVQAWASDHRVDTGETVFEYVCWQGGQVRVSYKLREGGGAAGLGGDARIRLFVMRGSTETTITTRSTGSSSFVTYTNDVSISPGDRIILTAWHEGGGGDGRAYVRDITLGTDGGVLRPGQSSYYYFP